MQRREMQPTGVHRRKFPPCLGAHQLLPLCTRPCMTADGPTHTSSPQDLVQVVVVNFGRMNPVNFWCAAALKAL